MLNLLREIASTRLTAETARAIHTTASVSAGARFRQSQLKERHFNSMRDFADSPCWSRLDGRPAPLNNKQRMRYELQTGYNRRVQELLHQVDQARVLHQERRQEANENKQKVIASKLTSKAKMWTRK